MVDNLLEKLPKKGIGSMQTGFQDLAEGTKAVGTEVRNLVTGNTENLKGVGKGVADFAVGTSKFAFNTTAGIVGGAAGTLGKAAKAQPLLVAGVLAVVLFNPVVNFVKNLLGMKTETQQEQLAQSVSNLTEQNIQKAQELGLPVNNAKDLENLYNSGINYRSDWAKTTSGRSNGMSRNP